MPGPSARPKPQPYQRADGSTVYRVRYRYRGKQLLESFPTLVRATAFCTAVSKHGVDYAVQLLDDEDRLAELEGSDTLDDVAERFLVWKATRVRSDRTVADYRRDYAASISPHLGSQPVGTITKRDVQQWLDMLTAGKILSPRTGQPLGTKSIYGRHALLHAILGWARAQDIINSNPAADSDMPKTTKPLPRGILPPEWAAIRSVLGQMDDDALDVADFIIGTGWRWSEVAALPVGAVEDYGSTIHVTMQQVVRRDAAGQHGTVDDAKAQKSHRRLALDADLMPTVRRACAGKGAAELVFTHKGRPWTHIAFYKILRRAAETAGVKKKVTPHILRHTHVGWMVMAGASLPELQARIGHASISTTINTYGSMITDVQPAALARFQQMRTGHQQIEP